MSDEKPGVLIVEHDEAIRQTLEQIDIITRLVKAYPNDLELASTAADFERIHRKGKIASVNRRALELWSIPERLASTTTSRPASGPDELISARSI